MNRIFLTLALVLAAAAPVTADTTASQAWDSGPVASPTPTAATPVWGKLVVAGNTVTCFYATGASMPTSWTQIGTPQIINFTNNPLLVGMYICAHNASAISTGTIDNFSITPAPTYQLTDSDIGAPAYMGSANLINGAWNLVGSGSDVWNDHDQCNFQPWLVWGDCTVICRVTSISSGDAWQKIGIMVRDGYNSGADFAAFCASYGNGVDFQGRPSFNNNADVTQYVAPATPGATSGVSVGYSPTGSTAYQLRQ